MNKKKWGGNSKIFSTIILFFVVCCFMATSSWAARKVDFYTANAGSFIEKLNQDESTESESIGPLLGLSQDGAFTLLRKKTDFNGVTHYRYQQTYKGFPVWGIQTIISRGPANQVVRLHGAMVLDIPKDIKKIPSSLDPLGALNKMEDQHKKIDENAQWTFRNEEYGTYIYLHKNKKAHLCFVVSFFADTECGNPSRPVFFVDVKTGKVIHSFDSLAYAYDGTGPGGNQKVGYYYYGTDYDPFCVAVNGSTCTMDCTDVKTVDLNHGTSGSTAHSYTCYENTHEEINGAYCPLNDAQYFGQVVFDTYMDWYSVPVLPFQLTLRCHYSTNYEGHFWDGSIMTFGDGYSTFYPLVALDIIGHEASHGFTEYNSGLIYSDQSGGINEAFSDIAGEGCEYYMRGTNDFMCGYDICQNPSGALRYLYDPPLDGISIDHVLDYYEGMDVNCSSGIFNKAFYLIATSPGWNTHMAFDIFVKANQDYWIPCINFQQGAEGALDAAEDYGYSYQDVVNAFAQVGITLTWPGSPDYCPSSGGSQDYEYIAGVKVGDLNNPSGPSPYSDFTHLVANITQGEKINVELTPGFPGSAYTEWWRIWIDYNDDHDFEDSGEEVFSGSGSSIVIGSFTVPDCTVCCTRMRVSMSYSTYPPICGTFSHGEVEDYTVEISGGNVDPPVADFTASATTIYEGDSVDFTDHSINNPTSWSWTFDGGTPSSSSQKNPTVTYNTVGTFTVTLVATNAHGSDSETKTDYITVAENDYCESWGITQELYYINDVKVANLNNPSGDDDGYGDFTGMPAANLTQGKTYSVSLTSSIQTEFYFYWKIWIDYNGDYDFDDAGEEVFRGIGKTVSGSISVPCNTIIGDTRMRVSMADDDESLPPCGQIEYGEVEDYTVNISPNTDLEYKVGNTTVFGFNSIDDYRLAQPVTMPEHGTIKSVSMYHNGGSGKMILAVYEGEGTPQGRLWKSAETDVNGSEGWQTIELESPEFIEGSKTIWLAWVYQSNPGVKRQSGSSGAYQSPYVWGGGMPDPFGTGTQTNYIYSIYATYTTSVCNFGYRDVFPNNSTNDIRRAQPFTMPEDGTIESISMYHEAGTGSDQMILAVYDGEGFGFPQNKIAYTLPTDVSTSAGWQNIFLSTPLYVEGGTKVWLAWVYEQRLRITTGIRYEIGIPELPGAVDSDSGWPSPLPPGFDPMPDIFRCSLQENRKYSIYAKYTPGGGETIYKTVGYTMPEEIISLSEYRQAMPFEMPENGTIKSITMYHNGGGSGDMILAVYSDDADKPGNLLAVTASTAVCSSEGWQTIELTSPEEVTGGTKIWLAWVYESNPGIRKINGLPGGAYLSEDEWSEGMPDPFDPFDNGTQTSISYSIFATYTVD